VTSPTPALVGTRVTPPSGTATVQDLARFEQTFADLADDDLMGEAWR
jgi:hypothetical protein